MTQKPLASADTQRTGPRCSPRAVRAAWATVATIAAVVLSIICSPFALLIAEAGERDGLVKGGQR